MKNDGEIVLYQNENFFGIQVKISNDTVWLTLNQMSMLFERDKSVVSRHIKNVFKEKELDRSSVVAFFATTAVDGKVYQTEWFNLDVIISVGYRIKSKRGTQFRIWANSVLKEYLVYGNVVNRRIENLERRVLEQELKFDQLMQQNLPRQGIFF